MTQDTISPTAARWIGRWLIVIALMVYAMILIGGATRLTDSGLSITEWAPISGTLPPLSEAAWLSEFEKYKATAEYQQQNYNMTIGEFQFIYWWEWGHRLFGRLIGLVAVGGFVWFAAQRWLNRTWALRLLFLIALGGLQGFIGWWMVASGIGETTRVDVAPYRLMTHFGLALFIIAVTAWFWFDLRRSEGAHRSVQPASPDAAVRNNGVAALSGTPTRWLSPIALVLMVTLFIQMLTGALVAGLDAGRTYTDWPLMAGELVPRYYIDEQLGVRSLFEGRAATQFNHRFLAYAIWIGSIAAAIVYWRSAYGRAFAVLAGLVTLQALWGIYTLVSAAPLELALVHQGLGVIVLLASVRLAFQVVHDASSLRVESNVPGSAKTTTSPFSERPAIKTTPLP
ncbi:MAG: COX15/CtaA family protein [Pseudomonadota bacterium]